MPLPQTPLDDAKLAILAEEVLIHTRAASASYNALRGLIAEARRTNSHPDGVSFWTTLQSFLMHAGMVSKFLNPIHINGKGPEIGDTNAFRDWRAGQIRRVLLTADTSALESRGARNFVEHIDENLDPWLAVPIDSHVPLIRRLYMTIADRDADAIPGFWCRVFVADGMLFCFDHRTEGRQEVPLDPFRRTVEDIDFDCATFWARVYGGGDLKL